VPYLFEGGDLSELNPRAAWLFWQARKLGALRNVAVVAERLVREDVHVRKWLVQRNRIVAGMSIAVVIPEARYRAKKWGTRHHVQFGLKVGRSVIVLEPRTGDADIVAAFEYFRSQGAAVAGDIDGALDIITELYVKLNGAPTPEAPERQKAKDKSARGRTPRAIPLDEFF
jgi:predicted Rossmann fold nucleotide-binding protein DprA/Smf involved in DNA uptake